MADGKQVTSGQFQLEGALTPTPIVIQASKLWEKADNDIVLSVEVPSSNAFVFEGGRLTSDFLDHETVKYKFSRGGQVLAEAEKAAGGVGAFCMRILAHLGKTSNGAAGPNIKFTMLVHPQNASDTLEMSPVIFVFKKNNFEEKKAGKWKYLKTSGEGSHRVKYG